MLDILSTILTVILIIVSILMIIVILLQSNRAAGGMFGSGSQTAFGAGSADLLTKVTGGFAVAFLVISFLLAMIKTSGRATTAATMELNKDIPAQTAPADAKNPGTGVNPTTQPAAPAAQPAQPKK